MQREQTFTTGEQNRGYELIDEYFERIQRAIDSRFDNLLKQNENLLVHPHFERRVVGVRPLSPDTLLREDDSIHMLLYKDKVVAVVTEQRNGFNNVQFSFFDNLEDLVK